VLLSELAKLEERLTAGETRLTKLKELQKEAADRLSFQSMLTDARQKLDAVKEGVSRAQEAETPFSGSELSMEDTLSAVKSCEAAGTSANTAASIARMFLGSKLIEAKRFTAAMSAEATGKVKALQTELEGFTKRLAELKAKTLDRKKGAMTREASTIVQEAEALATKVVEAAAVFLDDAKLATMSTQEVRSASEKTDKAEQEATWALTEAKRSLIQRQIEAKAKDPTGGLSQELLKLQSRLTAAQNDVKKHANTSRSAEQRQQVQKISGEALAKITEAEEQGNKAASLVEKLKDQGSEESIKVAEEAIAELQGFVRMANRFLDENRRGSEEFASEASSKLQPRVKAVQAKLESLQVAIRSHLEKAGVKAVLSECQQRLEDTEAAVKSSSDAEAAFLKLPADSQGEAIAEAMASLEAAVKAANGSVNTTRAHLGVKRVNMKRMSPELSTSGLEEIEKLQKRLDEATQAVAKGKKVVAEKQQEVVQREISTKLKETEALFEASKAASALLAATELSTEDLAAKTKAAGEAHRAASEAVEDFSRKLQVRQQEASRGAVAPRGESAAAATGVAELASMLDQADKMQAELETQRGRLQEEKDKCMAQDVLKVSTDLVEALEKKMEGTNGAAASLTEDNGNLAAHIYLGQIVEALRQSLARTSQSEDALAKTLAPSGSVTESKFVSYLQELPELLADGQVQLYSEEELKTSYRCLAASSGASEVTKEVLMDQFRSKYTVSAGVAMTDQLVVRGAKVVRKLQVNEVLEALGEPAKDEASKLIRVRCRTQRDAKEGFVSLSNNAGTTFIQPFSAHAAQMSRLDAVVQEMSEALVQCAKSLDQKMQGVPARREGPLAEIKADVSKLRPRIATVQVTLNSLRKKIAAAKKSLVDTEETEKSRKQQAIDRQAASVLVSEAEKTVKAVVEELEKVLPGAEKLLETKAEGAETGLEVLLESEKGLQKVVEGLSESKKSLQDSLHKALGDSAPFAEARATLSNLLGQVADHEAKCSQVVTAIQVQRKQLAGDARTAVAGALRAAAQKENLGLEALFDKLRKSSATISTEELRGFVGPGLKAGELELGLERYAQSGLTKLGLMMIIQDYMKCVKEIAITEEFEVKAGKTLRKLAIGELVEVVEQGKVEESTSMFRMKCRALTDMQEGWVTVKGNQGTHFFDRYVKPFYSCREEVLLQSAFESSSSEVRRLRPGQVVEVLEGSRRETAQQYIRVRGKAVKDGKEGWVSLQEPLGEKECCIEATKVLVCKQSTALTTNFDISDSKSVRKLLAGEVLKVLEEGKQDEKRSLFRAKVQTHSDGKEGWVTLKGNQGTSFVEESTTHYVVARSVSLESAFKSGSPAVRSLEVSEIFEMLDGPKTEKKEGEQRMRVRSLSDGSEGWFTFTKTCVLWSPRYRCLKSTDLSDCLDAGKSTLLRKLVLGELVEALDVPELDAASGLVRVRVRAEKDNAVGFATVRESEGAVVFLEAMQPATPALQPV